MKRLQTVAAVALAAAAFVSIPAHGDTVSTALADADAKAKCIAKLRQQLPDPETFLLNRRASGVPSTADGSWTWLFNFDAATKKGGQGHYVGFCILNRDGTLSVTIA